MSFTIDNFTLKYLQLKIQIFIFQKILLTKNNEKILLVNTILLSCLVTSFLVHNGLYLHL